MLPEIPASFFPALLAAFAASFHCVGMCGGFAAAASIAPGGGRRPWPALVRTQVLYHAGKTTTYLFLGLLAWRLGDAFTRRAPTTGHLLLAAVAALVLLVAGLLQLGVRLPGSVALTRRLHRLLGLLGWGATGRAIVASRSTWKPLWLGVLSGFLPCPVVWAFLAIAAAAPGLLEATAVLVALGIGTLPLLALVAWTGQRLSSQLRGRVLQISGALLIALAIWTLWRASTRPSCCDPPRDATTLEIPIR